MWASLLFSLLIGVALGEDECEVSKYIECTEPMHNATAGHPHGLFQNEEDLATSCPIIKDGIKCIRKYVEKCGSEMIAENYEDQYEKPASLLDKICDSQSSLRKEYLKLSPCMLENSDDFEICSIKVQEFLGTHEADTVEKELTMTCMYEMMLRSCLMSTGAEKCGMEAATFIRKVLNSSPSLGLQTCSKE